MKYNPPAGSTDPDAPYVTGNAVQRIKGSPVPAEAVELPQREIVKVILEGGLTPSNEDVTQLYQAILQIIEDNLPQQDGLLDCSTAAATAAKEIAAEGFELSRGKLVRVVFAADNTAADPTLNIGGTGAKAIWYRGKPVEAAYLSAGMVYNMVYLGGVWNIVSSIVRVATQAEVRAGAAAAGSPAPAVLRPEDIAEFAPQITPALRRDVFQTSGTFSDTVTRAIHLTIIAGGGSGGNGGWDRSGGGNCGGLGGRKGGDSSVTVPAGATLDGTLLTSSRTLTVTGGAAGNGGGRAAQGGGGEAGDFEEHELILPAGLALAFTVGAGGEPYTSGWTSTNNGSIGAGNPETAAATEYKGGYGAPGAQNGNNWGVYAGSGGAGGMKHPLYGGGGPGGAMYATNYTANMPFYGGIPGPGAGNAVVVTSTSGPYNAAGRGGDGALILEYWNSFAA